MESASTELSRAYVSLGANLPSRHGSPLETLKKAARDVAARSHGPSRVSSFWQSEPLDCPPGSPVYTNAVLEMTPAPDETPLSLLHRLQEIENTYGRVRSGVVNEARVLDLDLIAFGEETCDSPELQLPHPRAHERLFVLLPLQELDPAFRFPGKAGDMAAFIAAIDDQVLFRI